jgi:hypothetical protein
MKYDDGKLFPGALTTGFSIGPEGSGVGEEAGQTSLKLPVC